MTGRKIDFLIIGLLAMSLVAVVIYDYLPYDRRSDSVETDENDSGNDRNSAAAINGSIAVLPFVNMSPDPAQEFFADGISEEILNTLAAIRDLKVAGRTSSFQFKGTNTDLREIGKTLGVDVLLEGSVRTAGDRVRITAQLVSVENGFHLWSETFDRDLADIFAIQKEIAEAVGGALRIELGIAVEKSIARRSTKNLEAYSYYLQAIQYQHSQDVSNLQKALALSKRAMTMDPDFLPGSVIYGMNAIGLHSWGIEVPGASLAEIEQLMRQVIERDPTFADAWTALATSHAFRFQWMKAEKGYAMSRQLNSSTPYSSVVSVAWPFSLLTYLGRPEDAVVLLAEQVRSEPLALNTRGIYAEALAALGRMDEAEAAFRQGLEIDRDYSSNYYRVAANYYFRLGRTADAVPWYRKALALDPESVWAAAELALALRELGANQDAGNALEQLERISAESHVGVLFRYNFARLDGDDAKAEVAREFLANNLDRMVEGFYYVQMLEWLRSLQSTEPERALAVYRRIQPELFQKPPEVGPWNHGMAISLALLERQRGNLAAAETLARSALDVIASTTEMFGYDTAPAVAWLVLGNEDRAMSALEKTFGEGGRRSGWVFLEVDPVFESLKSRKDFQVLLNDIRADMARQLQQLRNNEASGNSLLVLDFTDS